MIDDDVEQLNRSEYTAAFRNRVTGAVRSERGMASAADEQARAHEEVQTSARIDFGPFSGFADDFTNPFEYAIFMRMAEGLVFDVILEGKSEDLNLLRLRPDLLRFAPDVAGRFGITAQEATCNETLLEEDVDADDECDIDEGDAEATE
ncbi:hypothetical protein GCM10007885_37650 [Methylobacterium gnaphalii]|nr:hypothetical protein GCM10007885_37650 [Methylobacterium gnaphalii]